MSLGSSIYLNPQSYPGFNNGPTLKLVPSTPCSKSWDGFLLQLPSYQNSQWSPRLVRAMGLSQGQDSGSLHQHCIAYLWGEASVFLLQAGSLKAGAPCLLLGALHAFFSAFQSFHHCLCEFPKLFLIFLFETNSLFLTVIVLYWIRQRQPQVRHLTRKFGIHLFSR